MEIIRCKSKKEASIKAGQAVGEYLRNNINDKILFLSSGGSNLEILGGINPEVLTKNITVTVLDTRFGVEPKDENYNQLMETDFYKRANEKGARFLNANTYSDVLKNIRIYQMGERFDAMLKDWIENTPNGKIVATIGMGSDGHIAGIMPFPENEKLFTELFKNQNRLAVAYEAQTIGRFPKRLTVTYPFFLKIDKVVSYIVGNDKQSKLLELSSGKDYPEHQFPGIVLGKLNDVSIFTNINIAP